MGAILTNISEIFANSGWAQIFFVEGGWKYAPSASSPFELDLGATGYLGKQQGLMFHAGVNYAF